MVVTDYGNDSVSFVSVNSSGVAASLISTLDLRPGVINPADSGVPGGEYPFWVSVVGNSTAYISCARDREIDVVNFSTPAVANLSDPHYDGWYSVEISVGQHAELFVRGRGQQRPGRNH